MAKRPSVTDRLPPLSGEAPLRPRTNSQDPLRSPGSTSSADPLTGSPGGHLATLRGIRRSVHQAPWERRLFELAMPELEASWGRSSGVGDNSSSSAGMGIRSPSIERRAPQDVRVRRQSRNRRMIDSGAPLCQQAQDRARSEAPGERRGDGPGNQGSTSAAIQERPRPEAGAAVPATAEGARSRCDSVPPTGTMKSDEQAALQAKSRAISALQKLFFEEMAKGGKDANTAAATALRRLTEGQPSTPTAAASGAAAASAAGVWGEGEAEALAQRAPAPMLLVQN